MEKLIVDQPFKGFCHKTCQQTCQRDEAMDSLSVDSLLPSSKTLRNAEPVSEQIEVNNYFARDVNIAEVAPRRSGLIYHSGPWVFLVKRCLNYHSVSPHL